MRATARLNQRDEKGRPERKDVELRAEQGAEWAIDQLRRADTIPEPLEYLHAIFCRLHPMRESDSNGPRRFSPVFITGAMQLFGWSLSTAEIEGLVQMDVATLHPGPWEDEMAAVEDAV